MGARLAHALANPNSPEPSGSGGEAAGAGAGRWDFGSARQEGLRSGALPPPAPLRLNPGAGLPAGASRSAASAPWGASTRTGASEPAAASGAEASAAASGEPDPGPDEAALVRAAAAGDRLSFRALYELCGRSAMRLAERIVRRPDLAEEVCQEAFCQAWARLASFRGEARFRTWLLTIVRNAALDLLRRERTRERFRQEEQAAAAAATPERPPQPGERLAIGELSEALRAALAELPEETRSAFTLAALEKLSYAEVATVLGGTVDGVKCRVYRAREHLRVRLAAFRE